MDASPHGFHNPLINDRLKGKPQQTEKLIYRMTRSEAKQLLVKDLAMQAAISYYQAVISAGSSHPPKPDTIIKTAETFEDYFADMHPDEYDE